MYLTPFVHLLPDLALAEMRTFAVHGYPGLPDDEYALLEAYCTDPRCDCRRVMLNVVARRDAEEGRMSYLASISYAFDRRAEFPGPALDPLNPQSEYAHNILEIVAQILAKDTAYVARLKRHYQLAKQPIGKGGTSAPTRPALRLVDNAREPGRSRQRGDATPPGKGAGTAMPPAERPEGADAVRSVAGKEPSEKVPAAMRPIFEAVVEIAEPFCREHLDAEYAQLSRRLAAALCRKRPSPLAAGNLQVWACAIVYALGSVNFLWDKTQTPHMRADELCRHFGTSKSTVGSKVRVIMDALKIGLADPRWYRPSRLDRNPVAWWVMVDRLMVDARTAPRAIQEEALRKGLIPYLPGSR